MKNWLNNYFSFTKREYNGLLVLMGMLLLTTLFPYIHAAFNSVPEKLTGHELALLQQLVVIDENESQHFYSKKTIATTAIKTQLFTFDPNKVGIAEWRRLGLSEKQAASIVNYTKKGGHFYKPEDVQKMYTITPQKYQELFPYISIANVATTKYQKDVYTNKSSYVKKELVVVEINGADTSALDEINGIGAAFARRIVKYRERLGGFSHKEQLMEVFGLDSVKFEEIKCQIKIDEQKIIKIDLNTATFDQLKSHPYLKYKQINAILQYRNQHGKFINLGDLKKVAILTPENIQQLAPYLIFK